MSLIRNKSYFITALVYFGLTLFSVLFMGVYYAVDHGLRDIRMTLLFVPCLVIFLFFLILNFLSKNKEHPWTMSFHMGFAAIYVYLALSAIIAMADCQNSHMFLLLILSGTLFLTSAVTFIWSKVKKTPTETN